MKRYPKKATGSQALPDREARLAMQLIGFAGFALLTAGLIVEQVLLR